MIMSLRERALEAAAEWRREQDEMNQRFAEQQTRMRQREISNAVKSTLEATPVSVSADGEYCSVDDLRFSYRHIGIHRYLRLVVFCSDCGKIVVEQPVDSVLSLGLALSRWGGASCTACSEQIARSTRVAVAS